MSFIRNTAGGFAIGVAGTTALFLALGADKPASQPTPASPSRYQISSWAHPRDETGVDHGAYRVDTQTGAVLEIVGQGSHDVKQFLTARRQA